MSSRSHPLWAIVWLFFLTLSPLVAQAAQSITTSPDEKVTFYASTSGVTRLSVRGDRIRRIVNDASAFEMTNDETTGDVFLRFSGEEAKREEGYLITESGVTVGFTLRPSNRPVEPVIITIRGVEPAVGAEPSSAVGDFEAGVGFSDNIALMMSEIVRKVAADHLRGKTPTGRDGRVYKRVNGDGWKAVIRVASGGANGRLVREQEFYKQGVRAIWVVNPQLGASERTFVVIVEDL